MSKYTIALSFFVTLICFTLPITSKAAPVLTSVGFNSLPGHALPTGQLVPNVKKVALNNCKDARGALRSTMIGTQKTICPAGYVAIENDLSGLQVGGLGGTQSYLRCCKANLVWTR